MSTAYRKASVLRIALVMSPYLALTSSISCVIDQVALEGDNQKVHYSFLGFFDGSMVGTLDLWLKDHKD